MSAYFRRIGVIGGMGPAATVLFFERIVAGITAKDDQDHIPLLIDNTPQIPSRIEAIINGGGRDPLPVLQEIAQNLEKAGCEALTMPCNTAHHYAEGIAHAVNIPLLNMVELTAQRFVQLGKKHIGMFASPALRRVGVYQKAFEENHLMPVYTSHEVETLALIQDIKAGKPTNEAILQKLCAELLGQSDALLIGCSELSLYRDQIIALFPKMRIVDSLDVLVENAIIFCRRDASF